MNTHHIILGDCITGMKTLSDKCVQTCITSPPYFGLRDYGTGSWEGGDIECDHIDTTAMAERLRQKKSMIAVGERMDGSTRTRIHDEQIGQGIQYNHSCKKCGAKRVDSQIGQEDTVDGYVQKMVEVFREVRRILRDDGTLWLNLGDSYMSAKNCAPPPQTVANGNARSMPTDFIPANRKDQDGLKTKDLIGIPWRVALALQADGWYLRQDIIWSKPNPMPESVADRCTKSHEYIFLLSKKPHYYYDHEAVKEPARNWGTRDRTEMRDGTTDPKLKHHGLQGKEWEENPLKNKRSVWTVNAKGYKGAHFAVYPEELVTPCVLAGCPAGGTVFDPFTGSGTTAVVALKNGRNYIGTELNPEYIKIAEARIKESVPQTLEGILNEQV
jgi:DNA modification methylase